MWGELVKVSIWRKVLGFAFLGQDRIFYVSWKQLAFSTSLLEAM